MKLSKRIPGDPVGFVPIESGESLRCSLCALNAPLSLPMTLKCLSSPCLPSESRGRVYYVTAGKAFTAGLVKLEGGAA
jgi:hypothetical protein